MKKKIAILVRARQKEALRMAVGLTLADDEVTVFVLGSLPDRTGDIGLSLEMLQEMGARFFSDNPGNGLPVLPVAALAPRLAEFDVVVPY